MADFTASPVLHQESIIGTIQVLKLMLESMSESSILEGRTGLMGICPLALDVFARELSILIA